MYRILRIKSFDKKKEKRIKPSSQDAKHQLCHMGHNGILVMSPPSLSSSVQIKPELSIDATKSQFNTARVGARSLNVSPDIHYSICSDSHSPNLRAATRRRTCSRTRYMNKNMSSSLRLYSTLKNSGKSSVLSGKVYPRVVPWILRLTLG